MAHVNITKDLTEVKSKVVFGLTKRQLIFFVLAALVAVVLIGVAVLAVGGLGYYFKIYKPKHELDDAADLDEFEFAGPEEPTIREEELEEPVKELTAEEEAEQRRLYEEDQELPGEDEDAPIQ